MPTALQARYVIPVSSPWIESGVVVIDEDRIVHVGRRAPAGVQVVDLNTLHGVDVAILPGLVNAHTHLEFSDLESPLGAAGMAFPDWIRTVIEHRQHRTTDPFAAEQDRSSAVVRGYMECLDSGTTNIGDIATADWPWSLFRSDQLGNSTNDTGLTLFYEMLGLANDRVECAADEIASVGRQTANLTRRYRLGLSPHAPYSTHWKLVELLCGHSRSHSIPLAMHLAESREELELLASHGGPFLSLLTDLGVWNAEAVPRGGRPRDYLELLTRAHRSLVIHGNYLTADEINFIAQQQQMSVVYCPRTHAYFGHEPYPLNALLAAGVNVALGTDSRASNPDLDLMREMRHVANAHPQLHGETILRMGAINGAKALGLEATVGAVEKGKRADLSVYALPSVSAHPVEAILRSSAKCLATYVGGQIV